MGIRHSGEEQLSFPAATKLKRGSSISRIDTKIKDIPNAPIVGTVTNSGTARAFNNGAMTVAYTSAATGGAGDIFTATSSPGGFTGTGTSPITVTGLQSQTSYTFTVTAANSTGTSPASTASSSVVATTVPQAPTIGTVTATNTTTVSAPFTAGATGGSAITSYTATSSPSVSLTTVGTTTPLTITGTFAVGQAYTFTITATNANGTSTSSSASNSLTVNQFITDNFNRTTTGSLGTSSSGTPWTATRGVWYANGSQGVSTDAASTYPIASAALSANTTVSATVSEGTGVVFWATDANNWYATVAYHTQTPYSCSCSTCCNTCTHTGGSCGATVTCNTCTHTGGSCGSTAPTCKTCYINSGSECGYYEYCPSGYMCGTAGLCYSGPGCSGTAVGSTVWGENSCTVTSCSWCGTNPGTPITCNNADCAACDQTVTNNTCSNSDCSACGSYSCSCSTCYSNSYWMRMLKSVSGTVSTVISDYALASLPAAVKVVTSSNTITEYAYSDTSLTALLGSTSTTPSSPTMGTNVGIIKTPAAITQGTTVDNFSAQ